MQRVDRWLLAGYAAQTLLNQLLEAPAGAVAGEHGEVVQMDVGVAVGLGDLVVIDLAEPVVGGDGAGVGQDQTAHGVGHRGVLLDAPVVDPQIIVHQILVVEQGGIDVADLLSLTAVEDIGLGHVRVAALRQDLLHTVLNVLHGDLVILDLGLEVRSDPQGDQIDHGGMIGFSQRFKGLGDGRADFFYMEVDNTSISFYYLIHKKLLLAET